MVFDGECGFCRRWIQRWRCATGDVIEYAPYQDAASRFPHVPSAEFARAVHLVEPDGRTTSGAEAVFGALAHAGRRWPLALYRRLPPVASLSDAFYRAVANHRGFANRITDWLWGAHVVPPGETRTAALFLRLMGVVYATAFVSLWIQVVGLVGTHGILPAGEFLDAVASRFGPVRYWYLPSFFWISASNTALHAVCTAGTICSLLAFIGFIPGIALAGAWFCYLSLVAVGQNFLQFQWDGLLLEAGFIAVLMAPWRWRLGGSPPPSRAALWIARWLVFRLMFTSAAVKLTSHDPTWRSLTALQYHYFTQPLPPWTAWYAHHWPAGVQTLSCGVMFAVEGVAPFLIFGPRRVRFAGAAAIATLQLLILATGNYGFFNLLTLVLCVTLLDDGVWSRQEDAVAAPPRGVTAGKSAWARRAIAAVLFVTSLAPLARALRVGPQGLGPVDTAYRLVSPLHVVNPYGLFAVMTTERPEIVVEGSNDGREWMPYEFRYKPGDLERRPALTTPHMPRLDWQMWFAALGDVRQNRWFLVFCWRLLEGSRDVTALLAHDPFPDAPPRYVRAQVYQYRFTTREERARGGGWWARTPDGPYVPALTLENGQLAPAHDIENGP